MTLSYEPRLYEHVAECNYEYFLKNRLEGKRTDFKWSCDWRGFSIGARYDFCWVVYLGPLQLVIDRHTWRESHTEFMRRTGLIIRGMSWVSADRITEGTIMADRINPDAGTISVKKPPPFESGPTQEKPDIPDEK